MLFHVCKAFNSPVIIMHQSHDSALRVEMVEEAEVQQHVIGLNYDSKTCFLHNKLL